MSIQAMKQALEALDDLCISKNKRLAIMESLRAAITEAERQEPVAWLYIDYPDVVLRKNINDTLAKVYSESPNWTNLYTAPQPAIPAGWQLVPVEPTLEMVGSEANRDMLATIYKAMLAAAPKTGEQP